MKAQDLMIGDLVYAYEAFSDNLTNKVVIRVESVSSGITFTGGGGKYCDYEDANPIPLTEEILLANKFQPLGDDYVFEIFERNTRFNLERQYHSKWYIVVGRVCQYIYYVHELQHALRLCGLNDLADNFKVE